MSSIKRCRSGLMGLSDIVRMEDETQWSLEVVNAKNTSIV